MVPVWALFCQASGPSRLARGLAGGGSPRVQTSTGVGPVLCMGPADSGRAEKGRAGPSSGPFLSEEYLLRESWASLELW